MIVVMKPDATALQIEHMANHITSLGLKPQVIHGTHQTVIAALGEEVPGLTEALEPGDQLRDVQWSGIGVWQESAHVSWRVGWRALDLRRGGI